MKLANSKTFIGTWGLHQDVVLQSHFMIYLVLAVGKLKVLLQLNTDEAMAMKMILGEKPLQKTINKNIFFVISNSGLHSRVWQKACDFIEHCFSNTKELFKILLATLI